MSTPVAVPTHGRFLAQRSSITFTPWQTMHIHLIIHPSEDDTISRMRGLVETIRGRGHVVRPRLLFERGDAKRLAASAARDGADLVVAAGGDGTVHEVVTGMYEASGEQGDGVPHIPRLGIVPLGTGNDLAGALGIPEDADLALEAAVAGLPQPLDVWRVNDHCLVNVSTGGFGAEAGEESSREIKKALGPLAYVVTGARKFVSLEASTARFESGDEVLYDGRFLLFAVGNGPRTGGGNRLTPNANLSDGLLDVCVVPEMPKGELLRLLPDLRGGRHLDHPGVVYRQVPEVTIRADTELSVNADGEPVEGTTFQYRRVERQFMVMTAKPRPE